MNYCTYSSLRFLNSTSNQLIFHVSRGSNNDPELTRFYDTFSIIAKQMNIPFKVLLEYNRMKE